MKIQSNSIVIPSNTSSQRRNSRLRYLYRHLFHQNFVHIPEVRSSFGNSIFFLYHIILILFSHWGLSWSQTVGDVVDAVEVYTYIHIYILLLSMTRYDCCYFSRHQKHSMHFRLKMNLFYLLSILNLIYIIFRKSNIRVRRIPQKNIDKIYTFLKQSYSYYCKYLIILKICNSY